MPKKAHPGFQNAERSIAKKENVPLQSAGAILASMTRKANPRLNKVKGKTQ